MVRCLVVLLALMMLLLCGCTQGSSEPPAPTENVQQVNPGIYIPDSAMEQATEGAIRAYRLGTDDYYGCVMLGDELVLLHKGGENGHFTLYRGGNLEEVRTVTLAKGVAPAVSQLQINDRGISYFDSDNKDAVFLNKDFVEISRMHLPETLQGGGWVTPDWKFVYYCTENGIYAMDLQTGIPRLLRQQSAMYQQITGGFGNGQVIRCEMKLSEEETQVLLIDGQTGAQIMEGEHLSGLITKDGKYFLPHLDRGVMTLRFGTEQDHQILWPAQADAQAEMIFGENAIVMVQPTEGNTSLTLYDLQNGERAAAITLEGVAKVCDLEGDGKGGVWLLVQDADDQQVLYRWNYALSATEDTADYTAPYYTLSSPDTETLTQLAEKAKELGKKFGIEILIWEEAAATAPQNQVFTAEHVTQLYEYYLPRLEQALSVFPEGFFTKTVDQKLKIALLRDIAGDPDQGTLKSAASVQFWNNRVPVAAVTLGEDFERNLYHSLYLYMETRLLSKSSALYEWYRMNPSDFVYDDDYIANLKRIDTTYIEGEKPYFINLFSMSFAREDRATIFEYACQPGNEEYFKTPVLQEKLKRICKGIREAYGLKKVTTEFLWEQYLA